MSRSAGEGSGPPWSLLAGVLFDAGDVLVRPTSPDDAPATEAWRRWFGGPRFVATIHWPPHVQTPSRPASGAPSSIATRRRPAFPGSGT
ncbi:MAG TPA: hypothetical protein VF468_19010 [Actinomycetota bacterium]|nr:hypothetical protein [Actinomycetota bacterium]